MEIEDYEEDFGDDPLISEENVERVEKSVHKD